MNNWNETVNEINRKRYTIPEGWDTKEKVAESLQCAPDRVADLLKPGIQNGDIERQDFSVWDESRRLAVRVTCYRVGGEKAASNEVTRQTPSVDGELLRLREVARVTRALQKHPNNTDNKIAVNARSSVGVVRQLRKELGL